jgi:hypothetical protein
VAGTVGGWVAPVTAAVVTVVVAMAGFVADQAARFRRVDAPEGP